VENWKMETNNKETLQIPKTNYEYNETAIYGREESL
jgi:hypothetical protein